MEPGCIVEFIDSQRIFCAVVLESKNLRLRLLTENNREVKLAAGRLTHRSEHRLDLSLGRDKLSHLLKEISIKRRALSETVDIRTLWEVLTSEQEWIDLPTMTALCYPSRSGDDEQAAVIRALFSDRLYFKFNPDRFFPHTVEQVEQMIAQREAAERQERMIEHGGQWLQAVLKGQRVAAPADHAALVDILSSYYLFEKDSPHREIARAILKKAGVGSPAPLFSFLVKVGAWHPHENLDLLRFNIHVEVPAQVRACAEAICAAPSAPGPGRRDLTDMPLITIDGPSTLDFDDALSISREADHYLLGIHIADVAHYIDKQDPIDEEALSRGSSIYMPDARIPMLPTCLSEGVCSLKAGQRRPALSTLVRITPEAEIIDFEIVASVIEVKQQLTYQDVDERAQTDKSIAGLHALARAYRKWRLKNGGLLIDLPEVIVWLDAEGTPMITRIDRESPGRMLVAEMMILANDLAARFLARNGLPAIFRSQPEPRERLFEGDEGTLFQNWMQRKLINRFVLGSQPEPHAGLGLPAYVTCTSPIRKYSDLVVQRQLRAALGMEKAYGKEEIEMLMASLEEPMSQVGRIQYRRQRYWLLKHLEKRIGQKEEAVILNKRRDGYAILVPKYMLECNLAGAENIKFKPEDVIQITLQHVSARNDALSVYLG